MRILSALANRRITAAINYLADLASPVVPNDWQTATKRIAGFIVFAAFPAVGLHKLTESATPVFIVGWAWGMLGMYGITRPHS